jgi:hypothetical protein
MLAQPGCLRKDGAASTGTTSKVSSRARTSRNGNPCSDLGVLSAVDGASGSPREIAPGALYFAVLSGPVDFQDCFSTGRRHSVS